MFILLDFLYIFSKLKNFSFHIDISTRWGNRYEKIYDNRGVALFFITTNISYSDYNMDTIKDEYHSKSSLNDSFDLVYSNIKIKNDELIFR